MANAAVTVGAAAFNTALAQRVDYTGGLQTATGRYLFTERTTSIALLNGVTLTSGRLRVTATLPVVFQNSTAVTYVGGTPVPTGGPDAAAVRDRQGGGRVPMGPGGTGRGGRFMSVAAADSQAAEVIAEPGDFRAHVGDPLLQAALDLYHGLGVVRQLGMEALVKVPAADVASGVGTGEWDYGAGASVSIGGDRTVVLANASYWVLGDMPELPLRNTLAYAASLARFTSTGRWSLSAGVMGSTAAVATAAAPISLGFGVGFAPSPAQGLNVGVSVGLTESAPDVSSYLGWRLGLGGRRAGF